MSQAREFDVFVAYNSRDVSEVRLLVDDLKQRELKPWLDLDQVLAGRSFQDEIQNVIPRIKSAVICIGLGGLGKWQVEEVKAFIHQCVDRDIPVIPVLLRGVEIFPERLIFLRERNYVLLNDVQSIDRIVQGINHQDSPLKTEPLSVKQKLENLYAEKKSAEQKIVYLSQEIGKLEAFLKDENNPQQETILSWLSQRSSLAKTYGLKSLRQFSDLNQ